MLSKAKKPPERVFTKNGYTIVKVITSLPTNKGPVVKIRFIVYDPNGVEVGQKATLEKAKKMIP